MEHILPKLGFDYKDLEPYIDAETMRVHHQGHHQAYVEKLNAALAKAPHLQQTSLEELLAAPDSVPVGLREEIRNNGGGHFNHSLFWQILTPKKQEIKPNLAAAIRTQYGSFDNFKNTFTDVAMRHFGSGYAWFCLNRNSHLVIASLPNQDTPLAEGCEPLLLLDLWEHAYYLKYQNQRHEFIAAFWNIVDWNVVEDFYMRALYQKHKQIPAEARH
jgi:superoxide dismutase, Fe-Mn family